MSWRKPAFIAETAALFIWAIPSIATGQTDEVQTIATPNNAYRVIIDDRKPEERNFYMPYTPTFVQFAGSDIIWLAGGTALGLYHQHPHDPQVVAALPDAYTQTKL